MPPEVLVVGRHDSVMMLSAHSKTELLASSEELVGANILLDRTVVGQSSSQSRPCWGSRFDTCPRGVGLQLSEAVSPTLAQLSTRPTVQQFSGQQAFYSQTPLLTFWDQCPNLCEMRLNSDKILLHTTKSQLQMKTTNQCSNCLSIPFTIPRVVPTPEEEFSRFRHKLGHLRE